MEYFRKFNVWDKSHKLVLSVYKITKNYPKTELYGLISQMRRASISVVANIVEGTKRKTSADRRHFLIMSQTSLEELKYYFLLSCDLEYIVIDKKEILIENAREIGRMLTGLSNSI